MKSLLPAKALPLLGLAASAFLHRKFQNRKIQQNETNVRKRHLFQILKLPIKTLLNISLLLQGKPELKA
jgi:hypothetical protein